MKKFKKIMAVLVAAMMIMATMVPAWAATDDNGRFENATGTITLENAKKGETYSVYKILDLVSFKDSNTATGQHATDTEQYSYAIAKTTDYDNVTENRTANPWYTFLTTYGPDGGPYLDTDLTSERWAIIADDSSSTTDVSNAYFVIEKDPIRVQVDATHYNADYYVVKAGGKFNNKGLVERSSHDDMGNSVAPTGVPSSRTDTDGDAVGIDYISTALNTDVQKFAQSALAYATDANNSVSTAITPWTADNDGQHVLTNAAKLGYYLIGTTTGTLAALDTTNKEVSVYDKNDEPQIEKLVSNKDGSAFQKNIDADFEDLVQFKTTITVQQGMDRYVLHDIMEQGLELIKSSDDAYATHPIEVKFKRSSDEALYIPASVTNLANVKDLNNTTITKNVSTVNYVIEPSPSDNCDLEISFKNANAKENLTLVTPGYAAGRIDAVAMLVTDKADPTTATTKKFVDIKDGDQIIVTYWARLKNTADIWLKSETATTAYSGVKNNKGEALGTSVASADDVADHKLDVIYGTDGDGRNENYTVLTYGDRSFTRWEKASVTTYMFDIVKTEESLDTSPTVYDLLDTAEFKVYKVHVTDTTLQTPETADWTLNGINYTKSGTDAMIFANPGTKSLDNKTIASGDYKYAGDNATAGTGFVDKIVTNDEEAVRLQGLEGGTYLIEETKAPTGYDILAHPIVVTINERTAANNAKTKINKEIARGSSTFSADDAQDNEGTITYTMLTNRSGDESKSTAKALATIGEATGKPNTYTTGSSQGGLQIINRTANELPSTGGMGTTVLYIVGGMLVILAGAYLFFSRKRTA